MRTEVFLVAISVNVGSENTTREQAEQDLMRQLPVPGHTLGVHNGYTATESWWIADDDRHDGSDNDSAVFVQPGYAHAASALLHEKGWTGSYNIVPESHIWEGPEVTA